MLNQVGKKLDWEEKGENLNADGAAARPQVMRLALWDPVQWQPFKTSLKIVVLGGYLPQPGLVA